MIATNITEIVKTLLKCGHGTLRRIDGSEASGTLLDIQSPTNDPDGIGFITLVQTNGKAVDVYENELAGLVDAW